MAKLNDLQLTLLARAAQRDSGSLYPLPDTITDEARAARGIAALVQRGLGEELETSDAACEARADGDLRFGMFITAAGLAAIGVGDREAVEDGGVPCPSAVPAMPLGLAAPVRATKTSAVLALLERPDGATLAELIEATGWLPHTTRAALTGLRKKGHSVERCKRDDTTCYRVIATAAR